MEENIAELLDFVHPNESDKFKGLENLSLTWKYLPALPPNPKKVRLFYRLMRLRDLDVPKASLCCVHGFAEHSGKFINLAVYFAFQGFEVHMLDLRSYGYSGGARCGHNLVEFQQDIEVLLQQARHDIPCFLWGHSMGGLLVTTISINNPSLAVSGLVISAPLYQTSSAEISPMEESIMNQVSGLLKDAVFNSYIAPACLSKDDVFLRQVFSDNKLLPFYGPELGLSMLNHMKYAMTHAGKITHPVIFFHGDADILTYASATEKVFNKAASTDKTFRKLDGVYHEPHHDLERDEFLKEASEWINRRIGNKAFGRLVQFKVGMINSVKRTCYWKYVALAAVVVYLIIAWKVKVKVSPIKLMKIFRYLGKLLWPLGLILS